MTVFDPIKRVVDISRRESPAATSARRAWLSGVKCLPTYDLCNLTHF
jgi:hypothetical protein